MKKLVEIKIVFFYAAIKRKQNTDFYLKENSTKWTNQIRSEFALATLIPFCVSIGVTLHTASRKEIMLMTHLKYIKHELLTL